MVRYERRSIVLAVLRTREPEVLDYLTGCETWLGGIVLGRTAPLRLGGGAAGSCSSRSGGDAQLAKELSRRRSQIAPWPCDAWRRRPARMWRAELAKLASGHCRSRLLGAMIVVPDVSNVARKSIPAPLSARYLHLRSARHPHRRRYLDFG